MLNYKIMNASEAREMSVKARNSINIDSYILDIKTTAEEGKDSLFYNEHISELVQVRLESLGYSIRLESGDQRDPYQKTIIEWNQNVIVPYNLSPPTPEQIYELLEPYKLK